MTNLLKIDEIIVVEGRDDTAAVRRALPDQQTIETHGFGISQSTWQLIEKAYSTKGIIVFTDPDFAGNQIRKRIKERFPGAAEAFLGRGAATKNGDIGIENANPEAILAALSKARVAGAGGAAPARVAGAGADTPTGSVSRTVSTARAASTMADSGAGLGSDTIADAGAGGAAPARAAGAGADTPTGSVSRTVSTARADTEALAGGAGQACFSRQDLLAAGLSGCPAAAERREQLGQRLGIGGGNSGAFLRKLNNFAITRAEFEAALQELD